MTTSAEDITASTLSAEESTVRALLSAGLLLLAACQPAERAAIYSEATLSSHDPDAWSEQVERLTQIDVQHGAWLAGYYTEVMEAGPSTPQATVWDAMNEYREVHGEQMSNMGPPVDTPDAKAWRAHYDEQEQKLDKLSADLGG